MGLAIAALAIKLRPVRTAFKEWAIVADALGRGEQILILRKGGIAEGRGGFRVEHSRFWLFPTLFHQQRDSVIEPAQLRYDEIAPEFPKPDTLRLQFFAEVVAWDRLASLDAARRLAGQHIWREEIIADRFEWGREQNIFALAVRVFRLPASIDLPMLPTYGGCKSWIELERDVPTINAVTVLDEVEFTRKLEQFHAARVTISSLHSEKRRRSGALQNLAE